MKIYIVRHGQTDKNKARQLQGRSNTPLNDEGRKQAQQAAQYFKNEGISFDLVYSSPLDRAVETGKIVSGNDNITLDDRLLEMDYGPYEGISLVDPPEEVKTFFKDFVHNPAPAGMENLKDIVARLGDFLHSVPVSEDANILVATHAIAMKGALEYLTPRSQGSYWSKYIGNCAVYVTEYVDGRFTVPYEIMYLG